MTASYIVRYWANGTRVFLIGGVRESQSSRWSHIEDAENFMRTVIEVNGGDSKAEGTIDPSSLPPEIIRHCPDEACPIAQAVGCICPHCGEEVKARTS